MSRIVVWNPFTVPLKCYIEFFNEAATFKNTLECPMIIVTNEMFNTCPVVVETAFSRYTKAFVEDDIHNILEPDDIVFTPSEYVEEFPDNKVIEFTSKSLQEHENAVSKAVLLGQADIFLSHLPVGINKTERRRMYKAIRKQVVNTDYMEVSETREKFFQGSLCKDGDMVTYKPTNEMAMVEELGSNFVVISTESQKHFRCWVEDITPLED